MKEKDIQLLLQGNDMLINAISGSINQGQKPEEKAQGRLILKEAIELIDKINSIKITE